MILIVNRALSPTTMPTDRAKTALVIPHNVVNLGSLARGAVASAVFYIKNVGADTLFIDGITPDCTCTQYFLGTFIVPPQDSTSLVLYITTDGKIGPQEINALVSANTEDRHYIVKVLFEVDGMNVGSDQRVSFVMDTINVGSVRIGHDYSIKQYIRNSTLENIPLVETYTSCRCLSFSQYPSLLQVGLSAPISLSFTPEEAGYFERRATVGISLNGKVQHVSFILMGESSR